MVPPSTTRSVPVMAAASSEARNATAEAISSGQRHAPLRDAREAAHHVRVHLLADVLARRAAWRCSPGARRSSGCRAAPTPGHDAVEPEQAGLGGAVGDLLAVAGEGRDRRDVDERPTPAAATMARAARCETRNGPVRLTPSTRCQFSALTSRNGQSSSMPALLTTTSMRPHTSTARSIMPWTSASSETSATWARARSPSASATAPTSAAVRETTMTLAPSSLRRRATASPMPRPPPVTMAFLPENLDMPQTVAEPPSRSRRQESVRQNSLLIA